MLGVDELAATGSDVVGFAVLIFVALFFGGACIAAEVSSQRKAGGKR